MDAKSGAILFFLTLDILAYNWYSDARSKAENIEHRFRQDRPCAERTLTIRRGHEYENDGTTIAYQRNNMIRVQDGIIVFALPGKHYVERTNFLYLLETRDGRLHVKEIDCSTQSL